ASWSAANNGLDLFPYSIVIDPTAPATLYVGGVGGVFESTDGAASWHAVRNGLPPYVPIFALAIDPADPTTLYAGTSNRGLYKSTDRAASWTDVTGDMVPPGYDVGVHAVAIDPANPSTLYAGTNRGLYKSTDAAAS